MKPITRVFVQILPLIILVYIVVTFVSYHLLK